MAVLVNGRRVTPVGRVLRTQSYAWGLALSPDGSRAAVLNKDAFELVDLREPYAGNGSPFSALFSRVTPGTSGYSNIPTFDTHASFSSGDSATANGFLPTRTDWTTFLNSRSTVTKR